MFCNQEFALGRVHLRSGDALLLYTDGLTEAEDASGVPYGVGRLSRLAAGACGAEPGQLLAACRNDLDTFRAGAALRDDLTLMAVSRAS